MVTNILCISFSTLKKLGKGISVKDRIKALETKPKDGVNKPADPPRQKRTKPHSKAFEEFESKGIIIGFVSITIQSTEVGI